MPPLALQTRKRQIGCGSPPAHARSGSQSAVLHADAVLHPAGLERRAHTRLEQAWRFRHGSDEAEGARQGLRPVPVSPLGARARPLAKLAGPALVRLLSRGSNPRPAGGDPLRTRDRSWRCLDGLDGLRRRGGRFGAGGGSGARARRRSGNVGRPGEVGRPVGGEPRHELVVFSNGEVATGGEPTEELAVADGILADGRRLQAARRPISGRQRQ